MLTFRDGAGRLTTVSATTPLPISGGGSGGSGGGSTTTQPDGTAITQVSTTMSKWADGFNNTGDTAPRADLWDVVRQTGMTMAISNGELAITTGAAAGNELLLVGKTNNTIPANLAAIVRQSATKAGMNVRIGYLACDATTGVPLANANVPTDFANRANFTFGASTTAIVLETISGSSAVKSVTSSVSNINQNNEHTIELRPEDVTWAYAVPDSVALRAGAMRISSQVPSASWVYRPFIWLVAGTANTSVTVTVQRIVSLDIQELQAEVGGGRGNTSASQAIPVSVVGSSATQAVSGLVTINRMNLFAETATLLAAAGALTGASRDNGAAPLGSFRSFTAEVYSDQPGTLFIERSVNNSAWFPTAQIAVPAAVNTALSVTCTTRFYRMRFVSSGTATQTSFLPTTAFTA